MAKAVVLGGGISGLSSAYYALQEGTSSKFAKVVLLEASNRFGGWLHSTKFEDGAVFDYGPRSFRPTYVGSGLNTVELALKLGLRDDIIAVDKRDPSNVRYVYKDKKVHQMPGTILDAIRVVPPLKRRLIWTAYQDTFAAKATEDESVHSFCTRRYGKEIADIMGDAMVHPSITGPMVSMSKPILHYITNWTMWSLKEGCQQLSDTLVKHLTSPQMSAELQLNNKCTKLTFKDGAAVVTSDKGEITTDHVFSSIYARDLAQILPEEHSELAQELKAIPAVSVIVVNLEYPVESPMKGFGHLLPSIEDGPVLGVVYNSCVFPQQDRIQQKGKSSRFTVMLGGAWYDELLERMGGSLNPNGFALFGMKVIAEHLKITEKPSKVDVIIQNDCIPQYFVGHNERVERIFKYIKDNNLPLSLVGSSYKGVSVNDCIYNAKLRVEKFTGPSPYVSPDISKEHFAF
ncbi:protoporphyrinogen oxidase-like [Ylistrum balloti]|uniref:protoporphyrinogen oxidase-like n=1 Tax=Ylistrum balloti TaxID=509963 RepID=UPI002905CCDD|nr:protoporphyrinogen oxidase-like [Ylistrum balloti]